MKLNRTTSYPKVMEVLRKYNNHYLWRHERSKWTDKDYENLNSGIEIAQDWYQNRPELDDQEVLTDHENITVSIEVIDTATGLTYPNIAYAARTLGYSVSSLTKQLSGRQKNKTTLKRVKK